MFVLRHLAPVAFAALAVLVALVATGCPRPCTGDGDCNEGEVCAVADGKGTCVTADPGRSRDAGTPAGADDAGNDVDAGNVVDAGPVTKKLRGALDVAPGVLRGGAKALKGHIVAPGAVTSSGGTFKLEAGAAPP